MGWEGFEENQFTSSVSTTELYIALKLLGKGKVAAKLRGALPRFQDNRLKEAMVQQFQTVVVDHFSSVVVCGKVNENMG